MINLAQLILLAVVSIRPIVVQVPLDDGYLRLADLLGAMYVAFEQPIPDPVERLGWRVNTRSLVGRTQLIALEAASSGAIDIERERDRLTVLIDREEIEKRYGPGSRGARRWLDGKARRGVGFFV